MSTAILDPLPLFALVAVNMAVFLLYGYDKRQAQQHGWRVSERSLLLTAVAGPFGAFAGMQVFRHKTQKPLFLLVVPALLIVQVVGVLMMTGLTW